MNADPVHIPTARPDSGQYELERFHEQGFDVLKVRRNALDEFYLTLHPGSEEEFSILLHRLHEFLREHNAEVVKHDVFGDSGSALGALDDIQSLFGGNNWPVAWVEGAACDDSYLAGMQIMAVSGVDVQTVHLNGRIAGCVFNDHCMRYCYLGNINPTDATESRGHQVTQTFMNMKRVLASIDMDYSNLARTWLFLDDILEWYGRFNEIRTEIFNKHKVFDGLVPASTGVGARNPDTAALCSNALAVQGLNESAKLRVVRSPLQSSALDYGSSFSRAVEIRTPDLNRLLISGTASIDAEGHTLHCGNIRSQINQTMRVVNAILQSRSMNWGNVNRAIAYFKHGHDSSVFSTWLQEQQVSLPLVMTQCDVCRDNLLFEIEIDALSFPSSVGANNEPYKMQ